MIARRVPSVWRGSDITTSGQVDKGTGGRVPICARRVLTWVAVGAAMLACAPVANADHNGSDLPWPQALPPLPVTSEVQPHGIKNCRRASLACVDGLMRRLEAQWRPLDAACDHRALFSYAYLQITKGIRDDLARP